MSEQPFVEVLIQNLSGFEIGFKDARHLYPWETDDHEILPDGRHKVIINQPDRVERHIALGKFLDAWSRLEQQVARLIAGTLNMQWEQTTILMNGLGNRGQMATINALLPSQLPDLAQQELADLCERIKTNNTKRNYIVHGYWLLEVIVKDRNGVPHASYREYRRYDPGDPRITRLLDERGDKKARKTYMFSIARIGAVTSEVVRLRRDLSAFVTRHLKNAPDEAINFPIGD